MPNYTFLDNNTGEEETLWMSMSEHEEYVKNNPHKRQILKNFTMVDPVNIGVTKPPSDFLKGVIGRMKDSIPEANKKTLEKRWHIPREW